MGLFDSVLGSVLGGGNQNDLAGLAVGLITNHSSCNGLAGLAQQFEQQGLGHLMQSWVGNGQNLPISAEQIEQALGSGAIQELAAKTGIQPSEVSSALTQILPQVVSHLTPNGQVPQAAELEQTIGGLLQKLGGQQ